MSNAFGAFAQPAQQQNAGATTGSSIPNFFGAAGATKPATPSPFGQPAAATTGTGMFGQPAQQQQQPAAGGPFGQQTGSTMFGQPQQQQQQGATSSIFGQPQQQQQQQGAGGIFGNNNNTANSSTPSIFGQPAQNQQQKPAGSLFGQSTTNMFGTSNAQPQNNNSLFGQSTAQGTSNPFGQSTAPNLFGQSTTTNNNPLTASTLLPTRGPSTPGQADQFDVLKRRIEGVAQDWGAVPGGQGKFQHYFYNLVDPAQVSIYGRPQNATNEALWQKAVRENPDSKCLVPVLAVGFDDLKARVDAQRSQAEEHQKKIDDIRTRLTTLSRTHSLTNLPRLHRALQSQTQLTHRLMSFIQHLHLLIPALRSSAIRPEEEELRRDRKSVV